MIDRNEKGKTTRRLPKLMPVLCAAGSILLYLVVSLAGGSIKEQPVTVLERDIYGGNARAVELLVHGLGQQERSLAIEVKAREYTGEEAGQVFEAVMEDMGEWILGDNPSLMEIRSNLNLKTSLESEGVRLRWMSGVPEILDSRGQLTGAEVEAQGEEGILSVRMSAGRHHADYEIPIRVFPPAYSTEEQQVRTFLRELAVLDDEQKHQQLLQLPGEYLGIPLRYYQVQDNDYRMIPLLGCLLAILLIVRDKEQVQQQRKKREQQMLLDYSEIVSKFMVFLGAGMTIRLSLERIVTDYSKAVASGRLKPRYAYEELSYTCYQIQSGVSEGKAYRELGERCRLQPYLKLGSLFEQNRRAGMKDLRARMKDEMEDAFEERKNLVRRLGEEASTKLALPLFMMLGVVMAIVLFPALMNIK